MGLIRQRASGRSLSPQELVEGHWEGAFRAGLLVSGDRLDAEDIAQDAMLKAARALDSYDRSRPLEPWINRIVANTVRDWIRRRTRRPLGVELLDETPDAGLDPADELADRYLPDELADALSSIEPEYRLAIVMFHLLDLPTLQIAEILEINTTTVRTRVHRGLSQMREVLSEGAETHANEAG